MPLNNSKSSFSVNVFHQVINVFSNVVHKVVKLAVHDIYQIIFPWSHNSSVLKKGVSANTFRLSSLII